MVRLKQNSQVIKYQKMHRCIIFKTQITTNTRALAYNGLYGSVTEQINHTAFNPI